MKTFPEMNFTKTNLICDDCGYQLDSSDAMTCVYSRGNYCPKCHSTNIKEK